MADFPSPAPMDKILVCTDGSPDSQGAVTAALDLARLTGSKVYLLQVLTVIPAYEVQMPDMLPPPAVNLYLMATQEAAVREQLETWKTEAAQVGVDLELRVRTSVSPYDGIIEEAEEIQAGLIIMGRHGFTGLTRLLMGSVTARVIGHSPINVLVVPREVKLDFQKILVASDGSIYSAAAWEEALNLSKRSGAALYAVSVARDEGATARVGEVVQRLTGEAAQAGVAVEAMMLRGRPGDAIVNLAQVKQVNLIILGSHGRTGLSRLFMGSVAERVVGLASCPVLVVKKK